MLDLTICFFIITLKENIQERELMIYKYTCNSSKTVSNILIDPDKEILLV